MRVLKIILSLLAGAVCGVGLMYLLMPLISYIFVGPIHGEDQMSKNFAIFFIGAPVLAVLGAAVAQVGIKKISRRSKI